MLSFDVHTGDPVGEPGGLVDQGWIIRIWSDNTLEVTILATLATICFLCDESMPLADQEWLQVESPPLPPGAFPVSVGEAGGRMFVSYSDGTTYQRFFDAFALAGCNGNPGGSHCVFHWISVSWTEFPETTPQGLVLEANR